MTTPTRPSRSHARRIFFTVALIVLVVAAAIWTLVTRWESFTANAQSLGALVLAGSFAFALSGTAITYLQWRAVVLDTGIKLGFGEGARVFFVGQLGKYVPGSVWSTVMQTEAASWYGVSRAAMASANITAIVLSLTAGMIVAVVALPFAGAEPLALFPWTVPVLAALVPLCHPRLMPAIVNRLLRVLGREPLEVAPSYRGAGVSLLWAVASWCVLGLHVGVLAGALHDGGARLQFLAIGGMALAVVAGVAVIPAPAGLGPRELVLTALLSTMLTPGAALVVMVSSRVLLLFADLVMAGVAALAVPAARLGSRAR